MFLNGCTFWSVLEWLHFLECFKVVVLFGVFKSVFKGFYFLECFRVFGVF